MWYSTWPDIIFPWISWYSGTDKSSPVCVFWICLGKKIHRIQALTKTFNCPSPSYKPKKINAKALTGTGHQTDPAPNISYSATRQTGIWPVSYIPSQSTCHEPLQASCQEHSISLKRSGLIQNRTSFAGAESGLNSAWQVRRSHDLSSGLFSDKRLFIVTHAEPYPPLLYLRTFPGMTETTAERCHERKKELPGAQEQLEVCEEPTRELLKPKYKGICRIQRRRLMGQS